ncbi:hypothetical protein COW36_11160 [bacterium (Candidatus Blackallbacteria) CG17_big_fil_post_rev_8_21_14_2_50_48_46]|uniref:Lipid-A-disaccharide synthase n=1 Tax=bacterium (Candidatus Blackallbacteria) CG17_big_fil_post_rev_8_21_14_2_50_48_46 TaxID=2014261 RepID=A0A2M7G4K8_9BACT|nr:MAG: hypothetical protein COW64_18255 [bacterium (Candidatus Blackallbacteria) CG18_big_fil_WC_8_21_14_2_50_49_26]PIW16833.1 MAG: hypothetical protein COW36_11160 [bacterium (Candidatus Blackallbacteria) CG17_big_fil_post_rev_8_21_14_2_50_48_46]PIW48030.1 MAG: hypothetical protein COW20_10875 [bacterium (Candidatus Blackallbacteria) CG13_big_fil_rev_8_21_14_2_50_49_14]
MKRRMLLLSNGMGEDLLGVSLAQAWKAQAPQDTLLALPLVGEGHFYKQAGIECLPVKFSPPSAGFAYLNPLKLFKDFQAGLGGHLLKARQVLNQTPLDGVLAVGDIVVVTYAWQRKLPFAFVGCALSDYYTQGRKNTYDVLQCQMLRQASLGIYPRDALTAAGLKIRGLRVEALGNPILDRCEPLKNWNYHPQPGRNRIALAPGSRQDAVANFNDLVHHLEACRERPYDFLLSLAPGIPNYEIQTVLLQSGWQQQELEKTDRYQKGEMRLYLYTSDYWGAILNQAEALIGFAGTAHEQAAGLGIPILTWGREGLQYTPKFAEAQTRLLGPALTLLTDPHAEIVAWFLNRLLTEPAYRRAAQTVQAERYGPKGASQRIVKAIRDKLA